MPNAGSQFDVVLVSMPFAPLHLPSAGLSALKPTLDGIRSHTFYFGFPFADRAGLELYERIAFKGIPEPALVGEWIFRPALFDSSEEEADRYLRSILQPGTPRAVVSDAVLEEVLRAREQACAFVDECARRVIECSPRIVAFTSVFQQQVASLALARRIKQSNPEMFVLFGGANCEGVMGPEVVRQFRFVDAAVSGEADRVFPELIRRIRSGEELAGLAGVHTRATTAFGPVALNTPPVRDLDALPYPDFDDFFEQFRGSAAGASLTPRISFETSRGCWWGQVHHCTFCGLNGGNMAFRAKSAGRAMEELEYLTGRYPGYPVMVADNILDLGYFKDFIPELTRKKLAVRLFYEVKANLKKDQVRMLRDAGITQIQPGIESFSDEVLELMRKGIRGLQNVQLLKWCKELGIWPIWNLIWGFPGESPAEYSRMAERVPLLTHLPPPRAAMQIRLDRFSPNYESSGELGFANVRPAAAYAHIYPFAPGAVRNLAYYFEFDYQSPRDVEAYTRPLMDQVQDWRAVHEQSEMFCAEQGDALWIWDLRPAAKRPLTILAGAEKAVYLACDAVRSVKSLAEYGNAEDILGPMVEDGLMLRDGDSVISLAVWRQETDEVQGAPREQLLIAE